MNQPGAKICIRCGDDCSDRPRLKDANGRYMCKACAAREGRAPPVPAAPAERAIPATTVAPRTPADLGPITLDDNADNADDASAIPLASDTPSPCPKCKATMPAGAVLCVACGHGSERFVSSPPPDPERLTRPSRLRFTVPAKCPHCSYDLKGIKSERCPECGELITPAALRRFQNEKARKEVYIRSYAIPAVLLLIGLAVWVPIYAWEYGAADVVIHIVARAIAVVLGLVAYFICCLLWMGFDAPWHLTTLRLLAIQNFAFGVTSGLDYIGLGGIIGFIAWILVTYSLLMSLMDMDSQDAMGYLAVVTIVNVILWIVLVQLALGS
jgi:predicted Zn-ribbon and HTH transcriptional regulator